MSRPTVVDPAFEHAYQAFDTFLSDKELQPRRLGDTDYTKQAPLKAVFKIIDECFGAIILGYPQFVMRHEATRSCKAQNEWGFVFPTPWNQIEGALAYRAATQVLVVAHHGVEGGVFDHGVTGQGVIHLDLSAPEWFRSPAFTQPFSEWIGEVEALSRQRQAEQGAS